MPLDALAVPLRSVLASCLAELAAHADLSAPPVTLEDLVENPAFIVLIAVDPGTELSQRTRDGLRSALLNAGIPTPESLPDDSVPEMPAETVETLRRMVLIG